MKVLIIHNRYQIAGGEDGVVQTEKSLLEANGHAVTLLETNNDRIKTRIDKIRTAVNTVYSYSAKEQVKRYIRESGAEVVHVHNFFPTLSPSVYYACHEAGVPVVQTLHNYRFFCATYSFFREGKVCENCLHQPFPVSSIVHKCYRNSRMGTGAVAMMQFVHRQIGTWKRVVDRYIAPTEFVRQKFIEAGLPATKIIVKPNFLHTDPGIGQGRGRYALFVGRLSPEKGVETLLQAWQRLGEKIPLKIVGEGPLSEQVAQHSQQVVGIDWLGKLTRPEVIDLMKNAHALIFPSLWYEAFPLVIVEAYASGLPVIASNLGSQSSLIQHQKTGLHFSPGNIDDLVRQVEWSLNHPSEMATMRQATRAEFEMKYTAEQNYAILMDAYKKTIQDYCCSISN